MGNCGRPIRISVIRFHNRSSKIGKAKGWAGSVGRAKDKAQVRVNVKAKDNGRAKVAGDARMTCEGLKVVANAARKLGNRAGGNWAWNNADRKARADEAPAVDAGAADPETGTVAEARNAEEAVSESGQEPQGEAREVEATTEQQSEAGPAPDETQETEAETPRTKEE